jgi:hypothetical protein
MTNVQTPNDALAIVAVACTRTMALRAVRSAKTAFLALRRPAPCRVLPLGLSDACGAENTSNTRSAGFSRLTHAIGGRMSGLGGVSIGYEQLEPSPVGSFTAGDYRIFDHPRRRACIRVWR